MKKNSLLINGGSYGHIIIPVPSDWDKRSVNSKTEYLNTAKKNAKKGMFGIGSKASNAREHYSKTNNILN